MQQDLSVAVILPTYNGARYLSKTINSVLMQTYENITLYIRDDGSTDATDSLIERISKHNGTSKRIVVLNTPEGNLGCPDSFYEIARQVDYADYYAFCDQDDIWLPKKIEQAVAALKMANPDKPVVYFCSFDYRDTNGELIRHAPKQNSVIPLERTLFYTPGLGFTIVFNRQAYLEFIADTDCGDLLQDRWILRCAAAMGEIIYDPERLAWHIRHDTAVTAADNTLHDLLAHYINNELDGSDARESERKIMHFLMQFSNRLTEGDKKTLALFSSPSSNICDNLRKAFFPHRLRNSLLSELALRFVFLLGRA